MSNYLLPVLRVFFSRNLRSRSDNMNIDDEKAKKKPTTLMKHRTHSKRDGQQQKNKRIHKDRNESRKFFFRNQGTN